MRVLAAALLVGLFVSVGFATAPVLAQQAQANWTFANYDSSNTNYDPQQVINAKNVQNLQIQWIYQVPVNPFNIPGLAPALGIETTPLVINGIVYVATPYNRLIALNSLTGGVLWYYQVNMSRFVSDPLWARAYIVSSLSYYNGTVYMMASDTSVYGFNAPTGHIVFTLPPIDKDIPGNTGQYYGERAPLIVRNLIIVRPSSTEYGGRGFVAAYDMGSKALVWRWYSVPAAGGNSSWDSESAKGNVQAYPGDWGNTNLIGGGAMWGTMTVDEATGILYFSTGHPSGGYDAALRPGPNLYTDSVVALNATNGRTLWYYQINPHDLTEHEGGWSVTLANINFNGQQRKVIIQAAKSGYVYVLDATNGKPIYNPVHVGSPGINNLNDNGVNANLTASSSLLVNKAVCPGPDGGVEMSPAVHGNTLFVAPQNACGTVFRGPVTYKGETFDGYIFNGDPTARQNSTLYAIDLSTGKLLWRFEMTNRYQGSAAVVSGGVVYVVDRGGVLYAVDEITGSVLRSINLGGLGASGVSIGADVRGEMRIYVPAGGGDLPTPTPGVVLGLTVAGSSGTVSGYDIIIQEVPAIVLGLMVVVLSTVVVYQRARKRPATA